MYILLYFHICIFYYYITSILALPTPSTKSLQHIYQVQLGRFLHDGEFSPEVKQCLLPLVSASIAIYYRMQAVMKPTPLKIHYTFNIRDLAKVSYYDNTFSLVLKIYPYHQSYN